uniref:Uncharacterized protein n=1 Tax=Eutreptiella gymnastica TaxID=73025 RepID=A0A7S4G363_9EUGL
MQHEGGRLIWLRALAPLCDGGSASSAESESVCSAQRFEAETTRFALYHGRNMKIMQVICWGLGAAWPTFTDQRMVQELGGLAPQKCSDLTPLEEVQVSSVQRAPTAPAPGMASLVLGHRHFPTRSFSPSWAADTHTGFSETSSLDACPAAHRW